MARFVQVDMFDEGDFGPTWVNPDNVVVVSEVRGILTMTLVNGDTIAVQGNPSQIVNKLRGTVQ